MVIIAHRGNLNGPDPKTENNPKQIDRVYSEYGFHSEIDLWVIRDQLWLGHDGPQYQIDKEWLRVRNFILWIHCKNIEALAMMNKWGFEMFNYFWHQEDDYTLTSEGFIWAYPGKHVNIKCPAIAVMPEGTGITFGKLQNFEGVCTDYPLNYVYDKVSFV